jgi:hypothetical protein
MWITSLSLVVMWFNGTGLALQEYDGLAAFAND